jgi:hypothetical protein
MNVQSLESHSGDLEADSVIQRCDYLVMNDTWLRDDQETILIRDVKCVTRMNTRTSSTTNTARGVAIYKHLPSRTTCTPLNVTLDNRVACVRSFGDVFLAEITVSTYVHPSTAPQDIGSVL